MQVKLFFAAVALVEGAFAASAWGQCGGQGWSGDASCPSGYACQYSNPWYSQCVPGSGGSNPTTTTRPATTTARTTATRTTTQPPQQTSGPAQSITLYTKCKIPNVLAVTFDDGPTSYQQSILNQMAAAGFKTTFFVNGRGFYGCIYDGASTLLSAYRAGHQIASHSWAHLHMTTLSTSQQQSEIQRVDQALQKIIGAKPTYMRAPFGETNSALQEVARQQGYRAMINWDIDSEDWNNQSPSYSFNKVQSQSYSSNGHIILMHENYQNTVQTLLPQIISWAKSKGVKLVTVGECLGESSSLWYRDVRSPQSRDSSWTC